MATIFLSGDVMTGRGIDQVLPHPAPPVLHEPYMDSALAYVRLAEEADGAIPRPVDFPYVWGDALGEFERRKPDLKLINFETSVTLNSGYYDKGINYRMNPANAPCLSAAGIDCCSLANNHALDWGINGLEDTLETLGKAGIKTPGAGRDPEQAWTPAEFGLGEKGRVLVFACGSADSGIPPEWAAQKYRPGVALLDDLSERSARRIGEEIARVKGREGLAVVSIHWGPNWGYEVPEGQRKFAHALIDAGADIIHGHSSHHVKGIEVYRGKLILYGCGDLLNDYEGITGYEEFRADLGLMYFAENAPDTGRLMSLALVPTQVRHFRVNCAGSGDGGKLRDILNRESKRFGTSVEPGRDGALYLKWEKEC